MKGIIGTGGHIDHGKTALVRALTGDDTDRLPEEQRRGISIDLGFSHLELDRVRLGIIDVPGHEDFIRNMLAGATGIDLLLLVVAGDEGVMPQTREHAAIAELLGVQRAVVALTKVDLVDDDWLGLVHDDLADFLATTPFAGAPVVPTSTITGDGLEELREAIGRAFTGSRGESDDLFRLPIDRAFTVRGTGTVVTGTVWSGRLALNDVVRLVPDGAEARVRGLQVHGQDVEQVEAGERAALALAGVQRDEAGRGLTVVADEAWQASAILTLRLRVLPTTDWRIEHRQRVRVHLGTAEVMGRVALLDREDPLLAGQEAWAQLRLEAPLVARAGDRVVVRSYSPITTIAGGIVAEPTAGKRRRLREAEAERLGVLARGPREEAFRRLLESAGERGVELPRIPVLAGTTSPATEALLREAVVTGGRGFSAAALASVRERLEGEVARHHERQHLQAGIDMEALRRAVDDAHPALVEGALESLVEEGTLRLSGGRVALRDWRITLSPEESALRERIASSLAGYGLAPPPLDELAETLGRPPGLEPLLAMLEEEGRIARLEHDLFIDAAVLAEAVEGVRDRFGGRTGLSPGDFRDIIDVSRRHLMPILGYLDRTGITVREAEGRAVHG